jgi:hypothetical protein
MGGRRAELALPRYGLGFFSLFPIDRLVLVCYLVLHLASTPGASLKLKHRHMNI